MTRIAFLSFAMFVAVPAAAQEAAKPADSADAPTEKLKTLLQNCDAHKFETTIESVVDGKPHRSNVKMCGNEGQTDSEWIESLEDAIAKLEANDKVAPSTRDQIVEAIRAEIARLKASSTTVAPAAALPPGRSVAETEPLSDDYTVFQPLPKSAPPPPSVLKPLQSAKPSDASKPALRSSRAAPATVPVPARPPQPKPKLSFDCISANYPGGGPCITLDRDTIVTVRAGEAIAQGVSLRFVRSGEERASLDLGAMRKGQSVRLALPQPVCAGISTGEVEIRVVRAGQAVDRQGPFLLTC